MNYHPEIIVGLMANDIINTAIALTAIITILALFGVLINYAGDSNWIDYRTHRRAIIWTIVCALMIAYVQQRKSDKLDDLSIMYEQPAERFLTSIEVQSFILNRPYECEKARK